MLRAWQRRTLEAFVDALIPASERLPGGRDTRVPARLESYLDGFAPAPRTAIPLMLLVIELFPLGLGPFPRPFSLLSREARTRVLERLEKHRVYPIRGAFIALKLVTLLLHAEDPAIASFSGWGAKGGCAR